MIEKPVTQTQQDTQLDITESKSQP